MKGHTYFQGENIAEEQKYMDKKMVKWIQLHWVFSIEREMIVW